MKCELCENSFFHLNEKQKLCSHCQIRIDIIKNKNYVIIPVILKSKQTSGFGLFKIEKRFANVHQLHAARQTSNYERLWKWLVLETEGDFDFVVVKNEGLPLHNKFLTNLDVSISRILTTNEVAELILNDYL